ncbi:membrane hypothetical protein [Gammaproteobacteria bacterium]
MAISIQNWKAIAQKVLESPRNRFILHTTLGYIVFAALWFLWSDQMLSALADATAAAWLNRMNDLAFVVVSAMLLILALHVVPVATSMPDNEVQGRPWPLLSVLLALTVTIAIVGTIAFHSLSTALRTHEFDALGAIARLKTTALSTWLEERRTDTDSLARSPTLRIALGGWLKYADNADRDQILALLEGVRGASSYTNVAVLDTSGHLLLGVGPGLTASEQLTTSTAEAIRTGALTFVDLHRRPTDNLIQMGYLAPVAASGGGYMPAVVFLEMRPNSFLFPFVQSWPLPSATGETLLIRREGDEIVYLNELRHRQGSALTLRQPASTPDSMATQALHSQEGLIGGKDYRQMRVLAVALPVPEVPWTLIAKVDEEEAVASIRNLAWVAGGLTLAALVVAAAFIGMLWQQQRLRITLNELAQVRALETAERRFRATFEQVAVGIAHVTPDGHWMRFNQRLCEIVGYSRMDLMEQTFRDLTPPGDTTNDVAAMGRLLTGTVPHDHWEQRCRRQDGSDTWIALTASLVRDAAGRPDYFITVIEDISARKAAEERVTRLTRTYRTLSETNQTIVRAKTQGEIFEAVCRVAVKHGGFRLACIGRLEGGESPKLVRQTHYGPASDLLDQLELLEWRAILQQIMVKVWEGHHYVCADTLESHFLAPWNDLFHRHGIYSFATFPLREAGRTTHTLLVYAPEVDYFNADMIQLLDEMAVDISFGLENLNQAQTLARTRDELERQVEERTRELYIAKEQAGSLNHNQSPSPLS